MSELTVEPARVRMARELKQWTQADLAGELEVTPAAISQFESGATRPSASSVQRLAAALDVPETFLFLPVVETHEGFFRSLRRTSVSARRRARALAHIAHDLAVTDAASAALPMVSIPHIPVAGLHDSPDVMEAKAEEVRRQWGLSAGPLGSVVELLEGHGIVVIRLPLQTTDVDAFSLPFPDRPVVVLGSDKDDRARSRFDAAHELGHLVAHRDLVWGVQEVENQAHAFAAALLMPADDIRPQLPSRVDWPTLFELKKQWQVSLAALLMRARTLHVMPERTYLAAVKAASARGWRRVEPVPLGAPERPRLLAKAIAIDEADRAVRAFPPAVVNALRAATDQ
jgi:Zn-dependent peptidase ImmA (M78 family)/transcriptional regulator with XRE-family HTH domain